ncbi:AAA family ATPase [Dactylosporangium sp. CA-052675]|uniref:bifunctional aminoglycoside phosphotransferase/ATP-binding protein n=1 Tax=Dactylosporangium sp. CA-052675 TaxID=3239927 RepID=UPI003D947571
MSNTANGSDEPFVAVHETHAAVVFLVGARAYKLKKPVGLGFLDFTTRERRQAVCRREVELNRRIAADVYLGVADVHAPDGTPCDHLVVMRRMPAQRRLAALVRSGAPVDDHLRRLARLVAAFHAASRHAPEISAEGSAEAILRRWTDSFHQVRPYRGTVLDDDLAGEIERRTVDFLTGRKELLDDRIAAGRIVDGHGDLLADDIFCLDDGPRVLDCIEFDDRLRWLDGLDDAAFLAMDLERLGAPQLGARFLHWYAEFAADPAPASLRHHYIAYRAFVRAKVACLRHAQGDEHAADDAAGHAELVVSHLRAGEVALVLVGGAPGTGKTTLAGRLADRLGAVLLGTDRIRKELAGLPPDVSAAAPYQEGIYTPVWTKRTYTELLARAETLLHRGESVILDASWAGAAHRSAAAETAARCRSTLIELCCEAAPEVAVARLRGRTHAISDADEHVAAALSGSADPWPQAATIRTDETPDRSLEQAARLVRPYECSAA